MKVLGREWRRKKEAMGRQKGELGVLSNGTEHADVRAPHANVEVALFDTQIDSIQCLNFAQN